MKQTILMEKYPVSELEVMKSETTYLTVDNILEYLKEKIDTHPIAVYISTFDHYAHTKSLGEVGEIHPDIIDAKNIICCFGKVLPQPTVVAVRPRSIGVVELSDKFVVSFMVAPNPVAQDAMEDWVNSIVNK